RFPGSALCQRSLAEDGLCGVAGEPPVGLFAHDNEINILKDSYNQVDVTRDCKPILKLEDHLRPVHPPNVYTLPELDEDVDEDNADL
ncbi:uncharacterized protein LOC131671199, partial [Phymastichus coffea]|uniref:uncharacterized protein LOC131671199 n=1 Tax=Phymastichus coffea TaxID=108790 RepID=UPI00273A962E